MAEKMKNSGVEWLGKIPESWNLTKIRYVTELRTETGYLTDTDKYIGLENISSYTGKWIPTDSTYDEGKFDCYKKGDLLFSKLRPYLAKALIATDDGYCTGELAVIKEYKGDKRFLFYYLLSDGVLKMIDSSTYGTKMPRASWDYIKNLVIPENSIIEQQAIADFLDKRCEQIDDVIDALEKQIELLKQYKTSLISECVTKGLNRSVQYKNSNNEWIGDVPTNWDVQRVLYLLKMPITDGPHTTPEMQDEGVPFVSAEAVSCGIGKIDFEHIWGYISEDFYKECCRKYVPQVDDIYMIKSGATTGRVSIVDTIEPKFTIWSPLAVFRCNKEKMFPRFMFYSLQADFFQMQVQLGWTYGTQQNIGMRTLEHLKVCVPPIEEQIMIVNHLDKVVGMVDDAINQKEIAKQKITNHKLSTIYEYVTGKKRVKEVDVYAN